MCDGFVVDADIMLSFLRELIYEEGEIFKFITLICEKYGIVATNKILTEWETTCQGDVFSQWETDELKEGRIRKVKVLPNLDKGILKKIHNDCGLPRNSKDIEYVKCANATISIRYIISDDIDLYAPKLKKADSKAKYRAKEQRQGQLCCFLNKKMEVRVGTISHCSDDFEITL